MQYHVARDLCISSAIDISIVVAEEGEAATLEHNIMITVQVNGLYYMLWHL